MANYAKIWNLANTRFLQCIASEFKSRAKFFEIGAFTGFLVFFYLDFSDNGQIGFKLGKYFFLGFALFAIFKIIHRVIIYEGFFEGYEKGFEDAATRNCDYWGDSHNQDSDDNAINEVMIELQANEDQMSEEHRAERKKQCDKGYAMYNGFSFNFKSIR